MCVFVCVCVCVCVCDCVFCVCDPEQPITVTLATACHCVVLKAVNITRWYIEYFYVCVSLENQPGTNSWHSFFPLGAVMHQTLARDQSSLAFPTQQFSISSRVCLEPVNAPSTSG